MEGIVDVGDGGWCIGGDDVLCDLVGVGVECWVLVVLCVGSD